MMTFIPAPILSPRQRQLCDVIERLTRDRGFPPTLVEAAAEMKLHPSRVHQLALSTQGKGYLTREAKVARSWRVVKPSAPDSAARPMS